MEQPKFVNNEVYHIYNRGVEKRSIFIDDRDRFRFIHDLYEFNDKNPVPSSNIRFSIRLPSQCLEFLSPNIKERDKLVEILAFCLMPNHFHLLIRQVTDSGVTNFMKKLGIGYTMYFNQRNERVGPLFQGRFKAVLVQDDSHFRHLYNYIHLNPLDISAPEWRENKLNNRQKALEFLDDYRWSSHLDYSGRKNFPSVIDKKFGLEVLGDQISYTNNLREWLSNIDKYKDDLIGIIIE